MNPMWPDFLDRYCLPLPSNAAVFGLAADAQRWSWAADELAKAGAGLLALWGSDDRDRDQCLRVRAAYLLPDRVVLIEHAMPAAAAVYPHSDAVLSGRRPPAARGIRPVGYPC